ncbi:STAS domain-containing protein [Asticcacaulis benevestitus]|uniref:STAS domain-containing protein n=1 Tax=Asticcacaulis benevestitus DSM 16100 = ATCC BAA-896 TaxID=1121022 RepID=V4PFQ6_9CAUL|nr:STAS domain-containing protein [Asticcacaulis benevestitus]ESQ92812.1 hypothetical protein ABENE_06840 [Asticcacaulis benevestitus DSM 16100 = ATCC BAA-896]
MRLEYRHDHGVFSAKISDKLTFSDNGLFRKLLGDIQASKAKSCVLDLLELDVIDSSGLGMLMIAHDESKKNAYSLTLINAKGPVRQLLQISKLDCLMNVV